MLRCLQRKETDPFFNIAAEEYILKTSNVDTFMVWRNNPSIIIGKHQNANREINQRMVIQSKIPVIRRVTGGGTVYHDLGNINFSFIRLNRKDNPVDFRFFTHPIIIFLQSMGMEAEFEGKSNIAINGLKVSGNSAHVFKGRVLHHGTLLFDTDLERLDMLLNISDERYTDRAVKSIKKKVANITSYIKAEMTVDDFMESFFSFIINYYQDAYHDNLNEAEYLAIRQLMSDKYRKKEWNIGYSPDYQYSDSLKLDGNIFSIHLSTKEAVIDTIKINGPAEYSDMFKKIQVIFQGILHDKKSIHQQSKKINFASEKESRVFKHILKHMF
jgi:lipoate-protein ligase A